MLNLDLIGDNLDYPTSFAFFDNDILVLEKDTGMVKKIGQKEPLLDLNVTSFGEHGLLGIAVSKPHVYLFYTESETDSISNTTDGNRLVKYEYNGTRLINPELILKLPSGYNGKHNGGKLLYNDTLYLTTGDANGYHHGRIIETKAQNNLTGPEPDGTSGILKNGEYFATGIRNSFGIDFDPVTGNLWDTENGDSSDEINLVEKGFNSGANIVEGYSNSSLEGYSNPEFVWNPAVGPTAIKFLTSDKYGQECKNDMFVGDFNNGNIYHFDLNEDRTQIKLTDVIKTNGPVIDIQVGPDGYLYFVSLDLDSEDCDSHAPGCLVENKIKGSIYRIN